MSPEQMKGAHGTCPVTRVVADNEQGFTEINSHDFDAKKGHVLWEEPAAEDEVKEPKDMSVKELKAHLTSLGIEYPKKATHEELLALVPAQ